MMTAVFALTLAAQAQILPEDNSEEINQETPVQEVEEPKEPMGLVPLGSVIVTALSFKSNSDYLGPFNAGLVRPVYSLDKRSIIIPVGAYITGHTTRSEGPNEAIHNRIVYVPEYVTFPDGRSFKLKRATGLDQEGVAGLKDQTDYHTGTQAKAIMGYTAVNSLPNIVESLVTGKGAQDTATTFVDAVQAQGQPILDRYLALVPTNTVRAGRAMLVFLEEPQEFPIWRNLSRVKLINVSMEPEK